MRHLATLPDGDARTLADYLLTLKIPTRLLPEGTAWEVWVCDEDQVPQARTELAEFLKSPTEARYAGAALAVLGLGGTSFALIEGPTFGFGSPLTLFAGIGGVVALVAFVESNNEQATGLESRAGDEWGNIGLQPGIGLGERAVMPVIQHVGRDE